MTNYPPSVPYEDFLYARFRDCPEDAAAYILACADDEEPKLVRLAIRDVVKAFSAPITRDDISNPYHKIPHGELLKRAGVVDLRGNYTIEKLPNGRIMVHPIDESKRYE